MTRARRRGVQGGDGGDGGLASLWGAPVRGARLAALAGAALLTAATACSAQEPVTRGLPPGARALPFRTVFAGPNGPEAPGRAVIADQAGWADLERSLEGLEAEGPDFREHRIVMAAMGSRPTGGYAIEVTGVYEADGAVHVAILEISPGPGCMVSQFLTAPVTVVTVPATGEIRFVEDRETRDC